MKISTVGFLAMALAAAGGGAARAGTLWIANMTPAKEVPPNNTTFSGTGFIVLNDAETSASVTATHDIPANTLTGGHIHRGPAGVNGPIILPFPNPASPIGPIPWAIPSTDVAELKTGGLYINIHTVTFPGGVIRDQFARVDFTSPTGTSSQNAVGAALNVSAGFSSDLDQVLFALATTPAAGRGAALDDLGGGTIYAQGRQAVESMHGFQETLFKQAETVTAETQGFGVFGAIDAEWGSRDRRDDQIGSKVDRHSILAGVQYAWGGGNAAGVAIGYASGKDKFRDDRGETEADTTSIQAYFTTGGAYRLTLSGGYGQTDLDVDRALPSFARAATASPDADTWAVAAKLSAPMQVGGNLTLSPYGQLDAQWADIDGYVESGAGAAGLVVPSHNYENVAAELGAALDVPFGGEAAPWTARFRAGWRHLLEDGDDTLPLAFIGSPVLFDQAIASPGRDSAHLEASISGALSPRFRASVGYHGFISSREDIHAVQLRLEFVM